MVKCKIFCCLALVCFLRAIAAEDRIIELGDQTGTSNTETYNDGIKSEEPSLVSRIKDWIFPPGKTVVKHIDLLSAGGNNVGRKYTQHPSHLSHDPSSCYSCNEEPWIPMASSVGQNTVISFHSPLEVPSPHTSNNVNGQIVRQNQYRPFLGAGSKPIRDNFGAPQEEYGPPRDGNLADFMLPPAPIYSPPTYVSPKPGYGPPNFSHAYGPQKAFYGTPLSDMGFYHPKYRPPQLPSATYGVPFSGPQSSYNLLPSNLRSPSRYSHTSSLPPVVPSDSYGVPVTGHSLDYTSSSDSVSLGSGDSHDEYHRPIQLPNLNPYPVLPFYNHGDFRGEFTAHRHNEHASNIQIVPSVEVGNYVASVQHPINVIQSPLVELNIRDDTLEADATNEEKHHEKPALNKSPVVHNDQNQESVNQNKIFDNINAKLNDLNNNNQYTSSRLSENPIVVDDTYTAASNVNTTFQDTNETKSKRGNDKDTKSLALNREDHSLESEEDINENLIKKLLLEQGIINDPKNQLLDVKKVTDLYQLTNSTKLVTPAADYTAWSPTNTNELPTSMIPPPPPSQKTWEYSTTKKPKAIQIIIPYIKNKNANHFDTKSEMQFKHKPTKVYKTAYTTLGPAYTPPPITDEEPLWSKLVEHVTLAESNRYTSKGFSKPTTAVYNIKDFLTSSEKTGNSYNQLPYDIISLQKTIDNWTHQEFSNKVQFQEKPRNIFSKKIPEEYLTTEQSFETTTIDNAIVDHLTADSNRKETLSNEVDINQISGTESTTIQDTTTNLFTSTTTAAPPSVANELFFSRKEKTSSWHDSHVTISNSTKEKIYVVTPQSHTFVSSTPATSFSMAPKIRDGKSNTPTSDNFFVKVQPHREKKQKDLDGALNIVFSEWPHLINSLQTTTVKSTSRHPLFGLMDIPAYTPPPNSTVETILGHSKVATAVTPVPRKK